MLLHKKKVVIFTSNRSDYGIFRPLLLELERDKSFDFGLIVGGSHLSKKFGYSINEIKLDNFKIFKVLQKFVEANNPLEICNSVSKNINMISSALTKLKPELILLLGDRFETFCAAQSSMILNIPIAHLHGGESTEGAIDEAIRHSITKMSHFHFVSTDKYKKRVIQMGEKEKNVISVGSLILENLEKKKLLTRIEIEKKLGIRFSDRVFLISFHPETIYFERNSEAINEIIKALSNYNKATMIFTSPNCDTLNKVIIMKIKEYVSKNKNAYFFQHFGSDLYLSLLKVCNLIIGNSSSGIIEAPSLKTPTINLGKRQQGRVGADSIIHSKIVCNEIIQKINLGLSDKFINRSFIFKNPYKKKNTAKKIITFLKKIDFNTEILVKQFNDL